MKRVDGSIFWKVNQIGEADLPLIFFFTFCGDMDDVHLSICLHLHTSTLLHMPIFFLSKDVWFDSY